MLSEIKKLERNILYIHIYQAAIDLVNKGIYVFPIRSKTKYPFTPQGYKDASINTEQVYSWFYNSKFYNIGINCEKSGFIVLDCDFDLIKGYNGIETIEKMEAVLGELPLTVTVKTPRGGLHLYFKAPENTNPKGKLAQDIDIKYRGCVLAPPSIIQNYAVQGFYSYLKGLSFDEIEPAELPENWIEAISKSKVESGYQKPSKTCSKPIQNVNFQEIANKCLFVNYCIVSAEYLSYQEWFAFASLLAQIHNGRELFHYYSSSYQGYNFDKTEKMFNSCYEFGKSQSCSYIRSICNACINCNSGKR